MTDLRSFFSPKSIAIIGASADGTSIRGRVLEYLLQRDYPGELYLISPSQPEIRGRKTYTSIKDVRGEIDLVLIAARASATLGILEECVQAGAKFAICYSSGFAEEGAEGLAMQEALGRLAQKSGMRICGPNTAGFFNIKDGIPATFARNVDMRRAAFETKRTGPGTISIVAQSGGLGFAMSDRCASEHGLIVSSIVSTGNEADLEVLDFVEHAIADADTRVILLLVEAFKNGARLADIAARARAAGKSIVVSKFGRTAAGSRAAGSHAARLTGSDEAYSAAFRRCGLLRVDDEDAMTDLAAAFSAYVLPAGNRVGILTTSGGAGVWMADACESVGLEVPVLDAETQSALSTFVPSYGAIHNPVDMTAQVSVNPMSGETKSSLLGSLEAMLNSPSVDVVILVANLSDGSLLTREQDALIALSNKLAKPLFIYSHAPASPVSKAIVQEAGLVCLASTRRTAETIARMVEYSRLRASDHNLQESSSSAISLVDQEALAQGLCEYQAKAVIGRYGIPVTIEHLAKSADEAVAAAAGIAAPVALKIQSRQIAHKTEVGGVILGLREEADIRRAFATLIDRARTSVPNATIDGVLVQKMAPVGRELAVGIVQDATFGPMMMVGMGGIHIEGLNDVTVEPLPVRRDVALTMLRRLRNWPLLQPARGKPGLDVDAVADAMEKLSRMVEGAGGACLEIDLNPIFVYDEGQGAVVVDAIVIGRDERNAASALEDVA